MLICFLVTGIWAGSIGTLIVQDHPEFRQTAEAQIDAAGRLFNRNKNEPNRTQPYDSQTAPPLDGTQEPDAEPVPEGMAFPAPSTPPVPPVNVTPPVAEDPPAADPTSPTDMLNGVLGSLTKLFNGEGNFSDIMNIAIAAFAIFGGGSTLGSDGFFKIILGLFSKKASFNDILKDRIDPPTRGRRRRRNR